MTGSTVLHYRMMRELGRGGMGVVYQALDTRLERHVALKFLPRTASPGSEERRRFEREARAAAALNHPHIAQVYAIEEANGEPFIVMEYVDGRDLRHMLAEKRLPYELVLDIAGQVAEALGAAHDRGIVHRDIKPANLMVTHDGWVKVMDFGLATLGMDRQLTSAGMVIGTVDYMSPEQVRGEAVDHRTDIWSFGVALYEMLCGSRPYGGESAQAVMYAILHGPRRALSTPHAAMAGVVMKMLAQHRDHRFQSMADVTAALRQLTGRGDTLTRPIGATPPAGPRPPGLAVLPFTSIRDDPDTAFLGFALADQVISALTYAGGIAVRPSSAIRKYQQNAVDAPTAGRELHVEFVLNGSYLKEADTIRLNVELVAAHANELVWRETIDVKYESAFKLQDIVSEKVLQGLNVRLSRGEEGRRSVDEPSNPQAYEYYLRAVSYPATLEGNQLALKMLEVATSRDPNYAPAHAELGFRLNQVATEAMLGLPAFGKVEQALKTALSLNEHFLPALRDLAILYVNIGRTQEAVALVEQLFRVAPGTALPRFVLGYMFRYVGLLEESAREIGIALALDPKNPRFRSAGFSYLYLGNYPRAYEVFDLDSGGTVSIGLQGIALLLMDEKTRAVEHFDRVLAMEPESFVARRLAVVRAVVLNRPEEAGRLMRDLERVSARETDSEHWFLMAEVYGLLGDPESSARLLRKAVDGGFCNYAVMTTDPLMDAVRAHPAVQEVIAQARDKHERFKQYLLDRWGNRLSIDEA